MKYYFLAGFLAVFSCNTQKDELFEINPLYFSKDVFILSDIADSIQYIPLDNNFPIGLIYTIKVNNNAFYLSTKDEGIIQFDWSGKFVRTIAKKGRGPSEYYYGMEFAVDEKSGRIYVIDRKKIKVYSCSGKFLKDISTGEYISGTAGGIEIFNQYLFIPDYGTYGKFRFNWIVLDTLGNLISTKKSFVQPVGFVMKGGRYKFDNKIFYYNMLNDSIFSISPNLKIDVAYLFSKGDYRWPEEGLILESISLSQLKKIFRVSKMFESKHFIFLVYSFKDRSTFLLIEKRTKKTYQAYKEKNVEIVKNLPSIINDLDEGLPFSIEPNFDYFIKNESEYIIAFIYPFELKAYVSTDKFKNSTPKYPEKKKALEKLANSLNEKDNPVLMLVKLKE